MIEEMHEKAKQGNKPYCIYMSDERGGVLGIDIDLVFNQGEPVEKGKN